ncbi:myosin heavy chain kinase B [Exaiptasia diaphana]|uniref:Alpha-type protein kinase domain-containing protein n=1 Tax=Exaiptasia diaphana TaxID=2652724 RepID=A0A913XRU5_EXADI|nr:myosin heavy chain kinase B [Exaiptasia diaphana]
MNALARNFAQNMQLESPMEFGKSFAYTKVYFSTINGECVTIENYIEGETFEKYINNDSLVCGDDVGDISLKSETFAHYTYERSNKQLIVLDLQGIGYNLCDPEIASAHLRVGDETSPILFCYGNLHETAINNFVTNHCCNKFCRFLQLPDM